MLIVRQGSADGARQQIILGLCRRDVEALLAGDGFHLCTESHRLVMPVGLSIAIGFGETEEAFLAEMREEGVVGEDAAVVSHGR